MDVLGLSCRYSQNGSSFELLISLLKGWKKYVSFILLATKNESYRPGGLLSHRSVYSV